MTNPRRTGTILPVITAILLLAWAVPALAYITLPLKPVPQKVAVADCVVVGKITATQPGTGQLYRHRQDKFAFVVADVAVQETLLGPKQDKVRLGFIGFQVNSGFAKPLPEVGKEGCFFAAQPVAQGFYVVPAGCFLERQGPEFEKDLALARRCCRALTQPDADLKSKDPSDRLLAAAMLALRYTYAPLRWGGELKGEPLDAGQSKLILQICADADWGRPNPELKVSGGTIIRWFQAAAGRSATPWPRDFPGPPNSADPAVEQARKAWLRAHAETFRLRRLVPANSGPPPSSLPDPGR